MEAQVHTVIDMRDSTDEPEFALSRTRPGEILVAMRVDPGHYGGLGSFYNRDKYAFQMNHAGVHLIGENVWGRQTCSREEDNNLPRKLTNSTDRMQRIMARPFGGRGNSLMVATFQSTIDGSWSTVIYNVTSGKKTGSVEGPFTGYPFKWYEG
jgi:hypothetical protein